MDLLLDVNVVVDHCLNREPYVEDVNLAMAVCLNAGGKLWVYAGSVQTLEYVSYQEMRRRFDAQDRTASKEQLRRKVRERLNAFVADKQWLAALAGEGAVFTSEDSEDEQLIRALDRFKPNTIKLLTRDEVLLETHPDKTISPQRYCQQPVEQGA